MEKAEGILLGSPTYFSDVTAGMRALIERAGMVCRANDYMLKYKVVPGSLPSDGRGPFRPSVPSTSFSITTR